VRYSLDDGELSTTRSDSRFGQPAGRLGLRIAKCRNADSKHGPKRAIEASFTLTGRTSTIQGALTRTTVGVLGWLSKSEIDKFLNELLRRVLFFPPIVSAQLDLFRVLSF